MKYLLSLIAIGLLFSNAFAVEITVHGTGKASITGYDMAASRGNQDNKANKASKKNKSDAKQEKEVDYVIERENTRKTQDEKLKSNVRASVVQEARDNAVKNAISILIDRTLGAGASKNPEVQDKFSDIVSQSGTYIIDQDFSGEVKDSDYIAKATLTVDDTAFRTILSDMGVALNTQKVRQSAILVVLDEFFAEASDLSAKTPVKETINVSKQNTTNIQTATKTRETLDGKGKFEGNVLVDTDTVNFSGEFNTKGNVQRGTFNNFSGNEKQFYQQITEYNIEYSVKSPTAKNLNYTQPALSESFLTYDIRALDNAVFKSQFFKGKSISADELSDSKILASYVKFAKDTAKADFFAIGVSYITDSGKSDSTGKNIATGNVFLKVYSTQDSEIIASGSLSDTASGASADQARTNVAKKIGNELGKEIAKKIQDYFKKRTMYGSEYVIQINGSFLPAERIAITKAVKTAGGVSNVTVRKQDAEGIEYVINYSGEDPVGDAVFMSVSETNLAGKFANYDYKIEGNNVKFSPIKK